MNDEGGGDMGAHRPWTPVLELPLLRVGRAICRSFRPVWHPEFGGFQPRTL